MLIDYLILFMEIYRLNRDAVFRMYGLSESLKKHALRAAEKNRDGFISLYEEYAPSAQTDADTLKTVICGTLKEIYNCKNRAEKAEKCLAFVLR